MVELLKLTIDYLHKMNGNWEVFSLVVVSVIIFYGAYFFFNKLYGKIIEAQSNLSKLKDEIISVYEQMQKLQKREVQALLRKSKNKNRQRSK